MSVGKTKEEVIMHKKKAIQLINALFEEYIKKEDSTHLKKVDLLSYWIEEFTKYIRYEEDFSPLKLIRYSRGDVIRVNFGFRVGSEFGGLHYAVVIENDNARNSKVVTVVPLSSSDGKEIYKNNVDLGTELYTKAKDRQNVMIEQCSRELSETRHLLDTITILTKNVCNQAEDNEDIISSKRILSDKRDHLEELLATYERNAKEIANMKTGSVVIINQITTVSKQRIYTPKRSSDFLYEVSLSNGAMDKISEKLQKKYLYKK